MWNELMRGTDLSVLKVLQHLACVLNARVHVVYLLLLLVIHSNIQLVHWQQLQVSDEHSREHQYYHHKEETRNAH